MIPSKWANDHPPFSAHRSRSCPSGRVRQVLSGALSLGSFPDRKYLRAVFSSIPDFSAANDNFDPLSMSLLSFFT